MNQRLLIFLLVIPSFFSSRAQETNFLGSVSPKLRKLCLHNPPAWTMLTNTISAVFTNKSVSVHYYYSDDEAKPRAFHYYPRTIGMSEVVVCVRENQQPWDEFITIVYELLNSRSESRFGALCDQARVGTISKAEFAKEMMRAEFEAVRAMHDLLGKLKLSENEASGSWYYGRFIGCPNDFEGFLSYRKKVSPQIDPIKQYEAHYDALRKLGNGN